ncbi:MAG: HEPN domain-containing protein [Syntrophales bacterium]|nr:HEPN domain-containing protein [Syntrophales bacterium]
MDEKVRYWVDISEYDLATAEAMLKTERYLYVGFMRHQAIEKILKAHYQLMKEKMPPKTHNLFFLIEETGLMALCDDQQLQFLDILNPMNVEARYPEYKEGIAAFLTCDRALDILKATKELYQWIVKRLTERQGHM